MPAVFGADQQVPEDLTPAYLLSDVRGTPVFSMLPKGDKLKNTLYSWAVTGMGDRRPRGVPEDKDVDAFEGDKSARCYNRTQRFWRTPRVTIVAEKVNSASDVGLKYNGQVTKKMAEQKRDVEYRLISTADSHEGDSQVGDEFKALGNIIDDGTLAATNTDSQTVIPNGYLTPTAQIYTGAIADFDEFALRDMAKSRFDALGQTGEFIIFAGSTLKAHISDTFGNYTADRSNYTSTVRNERDQFDMKKFLMSTVDVIDSEFGTFAVIMSSWIGSDGVGGAPVLTVGYGLDMEIITVRPLYYCDHTELDYRGGGRSGLIDTILGYEYGDPRSHIKIAPTS